MASKLVYLVPYVDDPPGDDSYRIYNMMGGKYLLEKLLFETFATSFLKLNHSELCLTMDLSSTPFHSLMFDIDISYIPSDEFFCSKNIIKFFLDSHCIPILKSTFLRVVKHFTLVIADRGKEGGCHLHFPEIIITHDDYIHLCTQLQRIIAFVVPGKASFKLDIPHNATLANSMKPNCSKYEPWIIKYFDEERKYTLDLSEIDYRKTHEKLRKDFPRKKENANSFFRKLLFVNYQDILIKGLEYMMPVPVSDKPLYQFSFSTLIVPDEQIDNYERIARFTFKQTKTMYIHKEPSIAVNGPYWLRSFHFLKFNSFAMTDLESSNDAVKRWHKKYACRSAISRDIFQPINALLKEDNYNFIHDNNPICTILEYRDEYYFLPVFYALRQYLNVDSKILTQHLRGTLNKCPEILDTLEKIEPKIINNISKDFSIDTILFCGSNMRNNCSKMRDLLSIVIKKMGGVLFSAMTADQLVDHIRCIQERHFPIVVASMQHSCKKHTRYMWNGVKEFWQEVSNSKEVCDLMNNIWLGVQTFLKQNGPSSVSDILAGVQISLVISAVLSESNMDRIVIEMDRHKWLLRTEHGIIDLLTGHVGATVPEYWMSHRRLGIHFDRKTLMELRYKRKDITKIYSLLTNKVFFQSFLKKLFTDQTDDLLDALREQMREENTRIDDPLVKSMCQFYIHLCKYTSFEYDRMMYLLDVISSLLIATNYARKFFIFKGETRNGKSKFFQMISKVFGDYSHTIRSVNLQTNASNALSAQPELASSLFSCRVVMVEEMSGKLNENLIKEITGNSNTSFRNLYEQNMGGIPTAKLFASTNTVPVCTATEAFKDRVVAFPFESVFSKEGNTLKTSEQVIQNKYPLDTSDSVIEDSYEGFFLIIYQHFIHNVNEDGTLPYREEPLSLVEYKTEFLAMTDLYEQFKQHADVQMMQGSITTFNDLKSAIRQFLKTTQKTTVKDTDLLVRFDAEFLKHKRNEMQLQTFSVFAKDDLLEPSFAFDQFEHITTEEEEFEENSPQSKKIKAENVSVVYYENIIIKNLRKENRKNF